MAAKHELISYNKRFRPGAAGVKLTFALDEMAFSREDMPLQAAIARREVILSTQPQVDGITKRSWNPDVRVDVPRELCNPHHIYLTDVNQRDPDFRRDFYDASPKWDNTTAIDPKLEELQFTQLSEEARKGSLRASAPLVRVPLLIEREMDYFAIVKEQGFPVRKLLKPIVPTRPKMADWSRTHIHRFDIIRYAHDGKYAECPALGGMAWSCCGNADQKSPGCKRQITNSKKTLYE